jgi:hypothetical protein
MERKPFKRQNRKRMKVAAGKRMDADTAHRSVYDRWGVCGWYYQPSQ